MSPTYQVQKYGETWAVRCWDCCRADATCLHSGPWGPGAAGKREAQKHKLHAKRKRVAK